MFQAHSVQIRPAEEGDLDDIAVIWRESAAEMDGADPVIADVQSFRTRIDTELETGWELFVAVASDRIVGMLAIKPDERVLDQLFVSLATQGRGLGQHLLLQAKRRMPNGFTLRQPTTRGQVGSIGAMA